MSNIMKNAMVIGVIALLIGGAIGWYVGSQSITGITPSEEIDQLTESYEAEIDQLKVSHTEEIDQLKVSHTEEIDKLNENISNLEDKIEELTPKEPPEKPTIRVARAVTSPDFVDYNRQKMFRILEERGYDVEVSYMELRPAIAAIVSGQFDFLVTNCMEYLPAIEQGAELIQIAPLNTRGYLVTTKSDINSIADLDGRIIGASSYTAISYLYMKYAVADAGVDPDNVVWKMVGGSSARRAALAGGSIDAGILYAGKAWSLIEEVDDVHILGPLTNYLVGGEIPSGICVVKSFLDDHPEAVKDVVKAGIKGVIFALTQRDDYIDEGMQWVEEAAATGYDRSYYEKLYDAYLSWNVWVLGFNRATYERAMQFAMDAESITSEMPLDDWNNFEIYEEALAEMYKTS